MAFKSYYLAEEVDEKRDKWAVDNCYHRVPADSFKDFGTGMSRFGEVHFVFARYTSDAEAKIRDALACHYPKKESVQFHGSEVRDGSYKLGKALHLNPMRRQEFAGLVCNKSLLKAIFEISPDEEEQLEKERKDTDQINLMVRVESVPKGAATLFTLRPRKTGIEPLFKRIAEHPRRA
jgi:hypothetical protein